ncbi:hypothetical protein [Neptunomonas phycophila]|uniref:hypothetical protein n=1 Tax=Neptunomonas phycophila TaxID=1572645 RepID=UPI0009489D48|nr:hypothetical protein [Neptunomonas phycophila]
MLGSPIPGVMKPSGYKANLQTASTNAELIVTPIDVQEVSEYLATKWETSIQDVQSQPKTNLVHLIEK